VCKELLAKDKHYAFVVDEQNNFQGSISLEKIALLVEGGASCALDHKVLKQVEPIPEDLPLSEIIERLVDNEGPVPVIDKQGCYCGAISKGRLLSRLQGETYE
jgi:glycine betaine/proline transport system ATP-binding protein